MNFRLAAYELRYVLEDSGARVALCEDSTSGPMLEAASGTTTRLVFVAAIPKTASGKILRRLLRHGQYTEVRP